MTDATPGPVAGPLETSAPGRSSAFAALRHREFRLFWIGLVVSNIGSWMQMFGLGYLVVQLAIRDGVPQAAPLYLGLVGLSRALPGLAFGLFAGAVADRTDRRRLLLAMQVAALLNALVLAVLTITDRIDIALVVLIGALGATIFAFEAPTRQAMVPRLVGRRDLVSAIGLNSVSFNAAQALGPILGGLLFIPFGLGGLFLINALSFLGTIVALMVMSPMPMPAREDRLSMLGSIREGLGYVRRDVVVRWVLILTGAAALLVRPWLQLLPAFTEQILRLGAVELSWLMGAAGGGALAGALLTASLGSLRRRGMVLLGSAAAMCLLIALFAVERSLAAVLPTIAIASLATMLFMGMANTLLQTRTPDQLRGRVMSVHTMVFLGLMPLGTMLLGAIGSVVGVDLAVLGGSLVALGVVIYAAARVGQLRDAEAHLMAPVARTIAAPAPPSSDEGGRG